MNVESTEEWWDTTQGRISHTFRLPGSTNSLVIREYAVGRDTEYVFVTDTGENPVSSIAKMLVDYSTYLKVNYETPPGETSEFNLMYRLIREIKDMAFYLLESLK
jgi:hypothetical protein